MPAAACPPAAGGSPRELVPDRPAVRTARHRELQRARAELPRGDRVHAVALLDCQPAGRGRARGSTSTRLPPTPRISSIERSSSAGAESQRTTPSPRSARDPARRRRSPSSASSSRAPSRRSSSSADTSNEQREKHLLQRRRARHEPLEYDPLVRRVLIEHQQAPGKLETRKTPKTCPRNRMPRRQLSAKPPGKATGRSENGGTVAGRDSVPVALGTSARCPRAAAGQARR